MTKSIASHEQKDQTQNVRTTGTEQLQTPPVWSSVHLQQEPLVLPDVQAKRRHGWWYYLIVLLLFLVIVGGAGLLAYRSYGAYAGWYNTSVQRAYLAGKSAGIRQEKAAAFAAGVMQGKTQQQREDASVLQQTKTTDAQVASQEKRAGYQAGKQDEAHAQRVWFFAHCRYDTVIAAYICTGLP